MSACRRPPGRADAAARPPGRIRRLFPLVAAALLCACGSVSDETAGGRIVVVDSHGAPIQGAFLVPVDEEERPQDRSDQYTTAELQARTSDSHGVIRAGLSDCLWDSDNSYHFRVRRGGYDMVTMAVSKELFPPVLRIEMRRVGEEPAPANPPEGWRSGRS